MTTHVPTGDNSLLADAASMRKIGWLERTLGPENYRIVQGLLKTPGIHHRFHIDRLFCACGCVCTCHCAATQGQRSVYDPARWV